MFSLSQFESRAVLDFAEYRRKELRRAIVPFPKAGIEAYDKRVIRVAAFSRKPLPLHQPHMPGA
jgi:hypothetical protein